MSGASAFGAWLLRTSLESSVLIALVFALRFALRRHLAPRWQYALWLLVVLRLALPAVPTSPTSVFNLATWRPRVPDVPEATPPSAASVPALSASVVPGAPDAQAGRHWPLLLLGPWAAIAGLLLVRLGLRSYRLTSRVCRQRPITRPDIVDLLEDCKQALGVHIPINVVQSAEVATPALLGFLRPRLLLPERLLQTFDGEGLRLLFLHELAHVKRRDILMNWLATLVHVVHWFNPLVALSMARMRADRELATDSLVLSHRGEASNRSYGDTLIRLLEFAAAPSLLPGTVGVLEDRGELRRRVAMIATHKADAYRRSLLAAAVLLLLAVTTLTGSVSATDTRPQPAVAGATSSEDTEPARRALTAWLALVDSGQYGASWDQASSDFRRAVKRADWEKGVAAVRGPLGAVASRTLRSASYKTSIPGAPDGEYVVVESETAFQNAASTIETGTLKKDDDGAWRAVGYFVRPNVDTSAAEKALADWLALVDAEQYGPSWDAASADFRAALPRPDWERAIRAARAPLGALISRRTQMSAAQDNLPGAPKGHYVVVQTEARFAKKASAVETCTLQQGADGGWRVGGYFIR